MTVMTLDTELRFFEANKEEWLRTYQGQFALVKGKDLLGTFTTMEEAFNEGIHKLGNQPFLIRGPECLYIVDASSTSRTSLTRTAWSGWARTSRSRSMFHRPLPH